MTSNSASPLSLRALNTLGYVNNILLIPMFTVMVLETSVGTGPRQLVTYSKLNLVFCTCFMTEWVLGLLFTDDRKAYLRSPAHGLDFLSAIPFGYLFQSLRIMRVFRVVRVLRFVWHTQRFKGKGAKLVRTVGIVGATLLAGALAMRIVEPELVPDFRDALWWSLVTLSTVGYGDIVPATSSGRLVASLLIALGIGVFGYTAGFMASLMEDPEEDEILERVKSLQADLSALREQLRQR
jgi:voltage-gated potassium channel